MSVYKEGWHAVNVLETRQRPVFDDAADYGVPVIKGDDNWNLTKQLVDWCGDKETREVHRYMTGTTATVIVELIDEGDMNRGKITKFRVEFTSHKRTGRCHFDGYVTIEKIGA